MVMIAPRPPRHYNSKAWMTRRYVVLKRTPEQIAEEAGCTVMTVYRKLREFELLK